LIDGNKHSITLDFPNCRDGRSKIAGEKADATLSEAFIPGAPIPFKTSVSGKFFLRRLNAGDPNARRKPEPEALMDIDGKQIEFKSAADIAADEKANQDKIEADSQKRERERTAESERNRRAKFLERIDGYCKKGEWENLTADIESSGMVDNISAVLEKIAEVKKAALIKDMKKAKDPESLKDAYEKLVAAANEHFWDADEFTKTYVDKRIEFAKSSVAEVGAKEKSAADAAGEISDLVADLRDVDGFKKNKAQIAWLYSEIATHASKGGKNDEALKYYEMAEKYTDADGQKKIEGVVTQMLMLDWKECVEKNKLNQESCDKKFLAKAKGHAKKALEIAKANGNATEDVDSIKAEYITTFGIEGPSVAVKGFGDLSLNQQAAGAVEQFKKQQLQQGMQEQQMNLMMRMGMINPAMMLNSPMGGGMTGMGMGGMGMNGMGMMGGMGMMR
jgi:hypothetical protein